MQILLEHDSNNIEDEHSIERVPSALAKGCGVWKNTRMALVVSYACGQTGCVRRCLFAVFKEDSSSLQYSKQATSLPNVHKHRAQAHSSSSSSQ
ncbi:hypothetical protein M0802_010862 [Mischocyttarus mexicanus]|nr:hypothetical protein M0802_010862 [Mischocyttarus mexicanus]